MLVLDQFQIDAISDIKSNNNVLVVAPTGSGKTLIAEKSIEYYLKKNKNIFLYINLRRPVLFNAS